MDNTNDGKETKPGLNAALIVIGLVLAALANTLDIVPWAQMALGIVAAGLLLWVLVRFARRQG